MSTAWHERGGAALIDMSLDGRYKLPFGQCDVGRGPHGRDEVLGHFGIGQAEPTCMSAFPRWYARRHDELTLCRTHVSSCPITRLPLLDLRTLAQEMLRYRAASFAFVVLARSG